MKANHATFGGRHTCPLGWPTLCLWSVFLSESIHFLPITFSLTEFFLR